MNASSIVLKILSVLTMLWQIAKVIIKDNVKDTHIVHSLMIMITSGIYMRLQMLMVVMKH